MAAKNLFVGNLSFEVTSEDLREMFEAHGRVGRAHIATDRDTGRSRGFGFVDMEDGADEATAALNGTSFKGRNLTVNEAKPREQRGGGGRNGGGGYGGGGYGSGRSGGGRGNY